MNKLRSRMTVKTLGQLALNKVVLVKKLAAAFRDAKTAGDMLEASETAFGEAFA